MRTLDHQPLVLPPILRPSPLRGLSQAWRDLLASVRREDPAIQLERLDALLAGRHDHESIPVALVRGALSGTVLP